MGKMLSKHANPFAICNCNRHHRPTISWGRKRRHQARAIEKRSVRKQINDES